MSVAVEKDVTAEAGAAGTRRRTAWSWLGRVSYAAGNALQERLRDDLRFGRGGEHLLLLEHDPVYTLGRNAGRADVLLADGELARRGVTVAECDRGGQVTYHGPGQLVGYPVIDLDPDRRDIRRYVDDLQETLVRTLADYGVAARVRAGKEHVGVWVGEEPEPAKIASLGVHLKRWITTHGFALNVTTDLAYFGGIVPCGLHGVTMTSIERETGRRPPLPEVAERYAGHFAAVFERELVPVAAEALREPAASAAGPR